MSMPYRSPALSRKIFAADAYCRVRSRGLHLVQQPRLTLCHSDGTRQAIKHLAGMTDQGDTPMLDFCRADRGTDGL